MSDERKTPFSDVCVAGLFESFGSQVRAYMQALENFTADAESFLEFMRRRPLATEEIETQAQKLRDRLQEIADGVRRIKGRQ